MCVWWPAFAGYVHPVKLTTELQQRHVQFSCCDFTSMQTKTVNNLCSGYSRCPVDSFHEASQLSCIFKSRKEHPRMDNGPFAYYRHAAYQNTLLDHIPPFLDLTPCEHSNSGRLVGRAAKYARRCNTQKVYSFSTLCDKILLKKFSVFLLINNMHILTLLRHSLASSNAAVLILHVSVLIYFHCVLPLALRLSFFVAVFNNAVVVRV